MANLFQDPVTATGVLANEAILRLRKNLVMGNLVHNGYSKEFASVGDTISIRKPASFVSEEFTTDIVIQNATESKVDLQLQHHLDVSFEITSKEQSLSVKDFGQQLLEPALEAHAQQIDKLLLAEAANVPFKSGVAGTTPATIASLTALKKKLTDNDVPLRGRNLVIDTSAEDKLTQLSTFHEADKVGDNGSLLREGSLGRKFGFDIYMDQNVPSYVLAGAGTVLVDNGAGYAIGATLIHMDGITTALAAGDLVTIGGNDYLVASVGALATADQDITLSSGLLVAVADNAPVTLTASHVSNLAFHKNAIALASAPLDQPMGGAISRIVNFEGMALRATFGYNMTKKKNIFSLDGLFGTKLIHPELASRFLG